MAKESDNVAGPDALVCATCIGNEYLARPIRKGSPRRTCTFCGASAQVVEMHVLGKAADNALATAARRVKPFEDPRDLAVGVDYESNGHRLEELVAANLSPARQGVVASLTKELLQIGKGRRASNAEPAWSGKYRYSVSVLPFSPAELDAQWNKYLSIVGDGSRFFNERARKFLNSLFKDSHRLKVKGLFFDEAPTISIRAGKLLHRARLATSTEQVQKILANPQRELGAPEPALARAGRMNAERVAVFYAAFDEATAVAELRPPIAGHLVVGCFQLTRALKVLDFSLLEKSSGATLSIWNPEFKERAIMRALLRRLHERVKRPVTPGAEHEYLATQVLAEYLSIYKSVDGLLFGSAQRDRGQNIVIFGRALGAFDRAKGEFASTPLKLHGEPLVVRVKSVEFTFERVRPPA